MLDVIRHSLREIRRRKLRSAFVMLGYAVVSAAFVVMIESGRAVREAAVEKLWDMGTHTMAFVPRCCPPSKDARAKARFAVGNVPAELFDEKVVEDIRRSPNVADASPYLLLHIRTDDETYEWIVGGFDPSRPKAFSATMVAPAQTVEGVFLEPGQSDRVMVEKEFAATHGLRAGSELKLGGVPYKVAAIVAPPLRPGKANIYMDIAELRKLARLLTGENVSSSINAVLIESKGAIFHRAALADIRVALGNGCQTASFGCSGPAMLAMRVHDRSSRVLAACVAAGVFLLLARTQLAYVAERRREIGILRAVGWSAGGIILHIMAASLLQAVVGGLVGSAIGFALSRLAAAGIIHGVGGGESLMPAAIAAASSFGLVMLAGLAAGLPAAWAAARLRPAEVLRRM